MKSVLFVLTLFLIIACVQPTKKQKVHLEVDARHVENINTISVRGQFDPLDWNKNFELSDADQDSIYTGSFTVDIPYLYMEFKLVKNELEFELNGKPNRRLDFDEDGETNVSLIFDRE